MHRVHNWYYRSVATLNQIRQEGHIELIESIESIESTERIVKD